MKQYLVLRGITFATDIEVRKAQRKGQEFERGTYDVTRIEAGSIVDSSALPNDVLKAYQMAATPVLEDYPKEQPPEDESATVEAEQENVPND